MHSNTFLFALVSAIAAAQTTQPRSTSEPIITLTFDIVTVSENGTKTITVNDPKTTLPAYFQDAYNDIVSSESALHSQIVQFDQALSLHDRIVSAAQLMQDSQRPTNTSGHSRNNSSSDDDDESNVVTLTIPVAVMLNTKERTTTADTSVARTTTTTRTTQPYPSRAFPDTIAHSTKRSTANMPAPRLAVCFTTIAGLSALALIL